MADGYDVQNNNAGDKVDQGTKVTLYYLYIIAFAEVMIFAQAASLSQNNTYTGYEKYAICLGVIGLITVMALGALHYVDKITPLINKIICGGLFVWHCVGVGITTFGFPFRFIGFTPNGFLGVWITLLLSAVLLGQIIAPTKINSGSDAIREKVRSAMSKFQEATLLMLLLVTSIVMLIVAAIQCSNTDCNKIFAFSITFAVLNFVTSATLVYLNKMQSVLYGRIPVQALIGNAIWWVVGFLVVTLTVNDFSVLSNGYLSALIGTFCAINLPSVKQRSGPTESGSV